MSNVSKISCKVLASLLFFVMLFQYSIGISNAANRLYHEPRTSVMDVKTAGLNVRSGPGTSYPIIAQVSGGTDIIQYCPTTPNGCSPTDANGHAWTRNYYPDSSIGYYANAALGYMAYYNTVGSREFNFNNTQNSRVTRTSSIHFDACPNLSAPSHSQSVGKYLPALQQDYDIKATVCNPNAWRVYDIDNDFEGYVNGWNLSAQ